MPPACAVDAVAVCLGLGVRPWQRHRVVQMIRRELKGGVVYSYRYRPTEHGWSSSAEAGPGPTWLRQSLGEPLFDDLFCENEPLGCEQWSAGARRILAAYGAAGYPVRRKGRVP
jgi:hypothetical protein